MARLSVNVNKVATLRNSRGGHVPSVTEAVRVCVGAGAPGITVHPRADNRHITLADVRDVAAELAPLAGRIEYNIEGDPREDLVMLVCEVRADQATLVPVMPGERTSQAGWRLDTPPAHLRRVIDRLHQAGVRVSLFVDPEPPAIDWAASLGADRVELYTEPYARAFEQGGAARAAALARYTRAAIARPRPRSRCERRPRSRPGQPAAVLHAAAHRGGFDRPRADQPCPVRGAGSCGP